jgi:hypothetical protein
MNTRACSNAVLVSLAGQTRSDAAWAKFPHLKRLVDEIGARPTAQRAVALKDKHKFMTEMDDEARRAMFRNLHEKVAKNERW